MLKFNCILRINADAPTSEEEKKIFMKNAEKVLQIGLKRVNVPDWEITVIDLEEE